MSDFAKIDNIQDKSEVLTTIDKLISKVENNEITEWDSQQADQDFLKILEDSHGDFIKSAKIYFSEKLQSKQVRGRLDW